jgi:beta-glucosidase
VSQDSTGVLARWSGAAPTIFRIAGRTADYRALAAANSAIEFRYRIEAAPTEPVLVGIRCLPPYYRHAAEAPVSTAMTSTAWKCGTESGALIDLTATLRSAPRGAWRSYSYPLACLAARGADLSTVEAPFAISTTGRLALTISEVRLVRQRHPSRCDAG